jgi:hypothetical protein
MNSDFSELLQLLNDFKVKYLLIGGYAYGFYAEPRYTKDIDLWVEASTSNAKKIIKALTEFGAPIANLSIKDLATPGLIYIFGLPPLRVDILNEVKGESFDNAYSNKEIKIVEKLKIPVVSKKTLIKLKKAAGRPQDKLDILNLKNST